MAFSLKNIFGNADSKDLAKLQPIIDNINQLEPIVQALSDAELKSKTAEFKASLAEGKTLDDILPEAFAVVREVSRRKRGERHFDVQLLGGIILHRGGIAEMRTGEGKTLVATLPVYLNALSAKGVHVVTVNDYLSKRDATWMGEIYDALDLTVGVINHDQSFLYNADQNIADDMERDTVGSFKVIADFLKPCSRREAYYADITYGTNNEFGFDYLRDNIEYEERALRQRKHHFAIVDEVFYFN